MELNAQTPMLKKSRRPVVSNLICLFLARTARLAVISPIVKTESMQQAQPRGYRSSSSRCQSR